MFPAIRKMCTTTATTIRQAPAMIPIRLFVTSPAIKRTIPVNSITRPGMNTRIKNAFLLNSEKSLPCLPGTIHQPHPLTPGNTGRTDTILLYTPPKKRGMPPQSYSLNSAGFCHRIHQRRTTNAPTARTAIPPMPARIVRTGMPDEPPVPRYSGGFSGHRG